MRVFAVQPDDALRRRLDDHLADRAAGPGETDTNAVLCQLLRHGLDAADAPPARAPADHPTEPGDGDPSAPPTPGDHVARAAAPATSPPTAASPTADAAPSDGDAVAAPDDCRPDAEEEEEPEPAAASEDATDHADRIEDRVGDVVDALYDR